MAWPWHPRRRCGSPKARHIVAGRNSPRDLSRIATSRIPDTRAHCHESVEPGMYYRTNTNGGRTGLKTVESCREEGTKHQRMVATTDRLAASVDLRGIVGSASRLSETANRNGTPEAQSRTIGSALPVGMQRNATIGVDILPGTSLGRRSPCSPIFWACASSRSWRRELNRNRASWPGSPARGSGGKRKNSRKSHRTVALRFAGGNADRPPPMRPRADPHRMPG